MQNVAPVINLGPRDRTLPLAFVSAVVSLMATFAAVGSTIPLFNIYRAEDGFTNADISLTVVAYSAATLSTLLVLGRLSNHVGRRPTAIAGLGLLVLGCLLLLNVHDIGILIAGRLLMGLGVGLASSTLTAYIVDAAPARPTWLASVASSQTVMLGLAVGAIASGALVQFGPWPRDLIYLVVIGLLLLSAALVAISPETVTPTPGGWRSLHPSVRVPIRVRQLLPVAAAVFLATWATGAFYQAFVPALVADQLHTNSSLVLGLVFAAYMRPGCSPWRPVLTSRRPAHRHDRLPGRMDRPDHSDHHQCIAVVHRRNHHCGSRSGHRHQRRHPWPAVRQYPARQGTDLRGGLSPQLQRRDHSQYHLRPPLQHLRRTGDRPRIRRACDGRHAGHCLRCTKPARPRAASIVSNLLDADEREGPKAAASGQWRLGGGAKGAASSSAARIR